MKKTLLTLIVLIGATFSYGQSHKYPFTDAQRDSILSKTSRYLEIIQDRIVMPERFKLYQTENIYTFLELDTETGQIYQLQWSLNKENEGLVIINSTNLSGVYSEPGIFELYPTSNMYQFILLNKFSGQTWHVQWGMEESKRWIRRID